MENTCNDYPNDQQTLTKIVKILNSHPEATRIILQFPKRFLSQAFTLTKQLRKIFSSSQEQKQKRQFYTLFDSMKKECCTDIIGAQHISYHILIHFGEACFSQQMVPNHFYLFPTITKELQEHFRQSFANENFVKHLKDNKIKYVLTEQRMYQYAKEFLLETIKAANAQLLKLPYDKKQTDQYLIFGYYAENTKIQIQNNQSNQNSNILVLFADHPQSDTKLLTDIHLTMGSFSSNKDLFTQAPQIFVSSLQVPEIQKSNVNYAKPLMARLSQIGQLQKHQVFGLLVSNAGTFFCQQAVERCKAILEKNHKKFYVFMMNNLNEVKLGNFPEIEVYVVISCFNNSCFSTKDFYRLVVTPMDLEVAFNDVSISDYNFDLNHPRNLTKSTEQENHKTEQKSAENQVDEEKNLALSVQQKQQIILANTLQTLDYYRSKEYKGLDFSEKKPVEKIKKGKIGLAQQYKPLPNEATQF